MQSVISSNRKRPVNITLSEVRRTALPCTTPTAGSRMNPVFRVQNVEVVLHPLDMVSVAMTDLGSVAGSLADRGQQIADALDELLTRSWG